MNTDKWLKEQLGELFPEISEKDVADAVDLAGIQVKVSEIRNRRPDLDSLLPE